MTNPITLQDITIYPVVEQQGPFFDVMEFFPTLTKELLEENRSWLQPKFIDPVSGRLVLCVQSFVIKTQHHNILIDSCVGNHKPRPARPFWNMMNSDRFEKDLAAAALTVNDIDYVMCTHLHVDHVGWNTRLENGRWVPTFPKAKYVMADRELAYWTQKEKDDPSGVPWITDSVLPIVEAERAQIVKSDFALNESIQFLPTPGHTIDHYSVLIGQPGHDAFITGDMIHSPIQGKYPELGMRADYDSRQAGQTRRKVFDRFCDASTVMCVVHFPSPSTGRVRRWGDGYKFVLHDSVRQQLTPIAGRGQFRWASVWIGQPEPHLSALPRDLKHQTGTIHFQPRCPAYPIFARTEQRQTMRLFRVIRGADNVQAPIGGAEQTQPAERPAQRSHVGRSLAQGRRRKAKAVAPIGRGDRAARKRA